jgi:hypothetical protein
MMMVEFVDRGYKVPYDPNVRTVRKAKTPDHEGFPRRPFSEKPSIYPDGGIVQEVRRGEAVFNTRLLIIALFSLS